MIKFILSALSGGVIGYITNWIAIKMLFKPHREIRLGRLRVPFTPGLIPKEKNRIAKSIGNMVKLHLLNRETFLETLSSEDVKGRIKNTLQDKIHDISSSGYDWGDVYALFAKKTKKESVDDLKNKVRDYGIKLENHGHGPLKSMEIQTDAGLEKMMPDNRTIKDILPEGVLKGIKKLIHDNGAAIGGALYDFSKKPGTSEGVNDIIDGILKGKGNKLINSLVNREYITSKLLESFGNFVRDGKNYDMICDITYGLVLEVFGLKVRDVVRLPVLLKDMLFHMTKTEEFFLLTDEIVEKVAAMPLSLLLDKLDREKSVNFFINLYENFLVEKIVSAIESLNLEKMIEDKINSFDFLQLEELILGLTKKELGAITKLGAVLGALMGILFTAFERFI